VHYTHHKINLLRSLLLLNYVLVVLFIELAHTHEPDLVFHDNCPACIWEVQARDRDITTAAIWDLLSRACDLSLCNIVYTPLFFIHQSLPADNASRAPPC